jgi:hypothetical protein
MGVECVCKLKDEIACAFVESAKAYELFGSSLQKELELSLCLHFLL